MRRAHHGLVNAPQLAKTVVDRLADQPALHARIIPRRQQSRRPALARRISFRSDWLETTASSYTGSPPGAGTASPQKSAPSRPNHSEIEPAECPGV
jgi:hypothetical protein